MHYSNKHSNKNIVSIEFKSYYHSHSYYVSILRIKHDINGEDWWNSYEESFQNSPKVTSFCFKNFNPYPLRSLTQMCVKPTLQYVMPESPSGLGEKTLCNSSDEILTVG